MAEKSRGRRRTPKPLISQRFYIFLAPSRLVSRLDSFQSTGQSTELVLAAHRMAISRLVSRLDLVQSTGQSTDLLVQSTVQSTELNRNAQ